MNRAIVTDGDVRRRVELESAGRVAGGGPPADNYLGRLMKLIPGEIIALYLGVDAGLARLPVSQRLAVACLVFGVFFVGTFFWLANQHVERITQRLITMGAFAVWVFATSSGPLAYVEGGKAIAEAYGPIVVGVFTFASALIPLPDAKEPATQAHPPPALAP